MGDINQSYFLEKHLPKKTFNNILDIGSKDYGNTQNFRSIIEHKNYVGIDMEAGKNVDHVIDLTKTIEPLQENFFDLILCCSVIEHVEYPWIFADNVAKLSTKGGLLYIAVPFVWKFHGYPNDYYRYTHNGVKKIFKEYNWDKSYFSTYGINEIFGISNDEKFAKDLNKLSMRVKNEDFKLTENSTSTMGLDLRETTTPQKALSYIQILMIGEKK